MAAAANLGMSRGGDRDKDRDHRKAVWIRQGTILTQDPDVGDWIGDVLVEDGQITHVGAALPRVRGAQEVNARGMIVIPGLIDNHRHTWQAVIRGYACNLTFPQYAEQVLRGVSARMTDDDVYVGVLLSAYEALNAGTTTVLAWEHAINTPKHAWAGIEALEMAGIRATFGYHGPASDMGPENPVRFENLEKVHEYLSRNPLINLAIATNGSEVRPESQERFYIDLDRARELGVVASIHAGFTDITPSLPEMLVTDGKMGNNLCFIHANQWDERIFRIVNEHGAHVTFSPEIELQMFPIPKLAEMLAGGLEPTISVDIPSGIDGDMLQQLKLALQIERQRQIGSETLPLVSVDMLPMATRNAAKSLKLQDRVGMIKEGLRGDIAILNPPGPFTDPYAAVVHYTHPQHVDTVLVDGRIVKRYGKLAAHNHLGSLYREAAKIMKRVTGV